MDRRAFFRRIAGRVADTTLSVAEQAAADAARAWIRPPFALPELEFLLACTRCDACIEACPHHSLFRLPARLGIKVAGTPALDLVHKACHLCDDWPCVAACGEGALRMQEGGPELPPLALCSIDTTTCLPWSGPECGACAGSCPVPGALTWDGPKPSIEPDKCIGCALCREACIAEPKAIRVQSRPSPRESGAG